MNPLTQQPSVWTESLSLVLSHTFTHTLLPSFTRVLTHSLSIHTSIHPSIHPSLHPPSLAEQRVIPGALRAQVDCRWRGEPESCSRGTGGWVGAVSFGAGRSRLPAKMKVNLSSSGLSCPSPPHHRLAPPLLHPILPCAPAAHVPLWLSLAPQNS